MTSMVMEMMRRILIIAEMVLVNTFNIFNIHTLVKHAFHLLMLLEKLANERAKCTGE